MTSLLIALLLSTTTERVGALAVETPEGFTRNGNRFVAEHSQWVFDPEAKTPDPARWATEALSASMSSLREPFATAMSWDIRYCSAAIRLPHRPTAINRATTRTASCG
jgi:hypothetical protein